MMPDTLEKRVSNLGEMVQDIPKLLNFLFERIDAALDGIKAELKVAKTERAEIRQHLEALPRVIAEMIN